VDSTPQYTPHSVFSFNGPGKLGAWNSLGSALLPVWMVYAAFR
jgi:hypothetical protein